MLRYTAQLRDVGELIPFLILYIYIYINQGTVQSATI